MFVRFFIAFAATIAYMAVIALFAYGLNDGGNTMINVAIAGCIGFIPFFIVVNNRVFLWRATSTPAVSLDSIKQAISDITIEGQPFEITASGNHYVLTPQYISESFTTFLRRHHIRQAYYMSLWFDEKKQTVRFKDHLVAATSTLTPERLSATRSAQSGMILASLYTLGDSGQLKKFNNLALHKAVIKAVTDHGWNLKVKVL